MIRNAASSSASYSLWSSATRIVAKRKRPLAVSDLCNGISSLHDLPRTISRWASSSVVAVEKYSASAKDDPSTHSDAHVNSSPNSHSAHIVTPDNAETTAIVDGLLVYTRQLMEGNHHKPTPSLLVEPNGSPSSTSHQQLAVHVGRHVVAYSGGIDSSLVLALLHQSQRPDEVVQAVLGISPAVPQEQVALARQVADHIGAALVEVPTTEGSDDVYIANEGQACLACKTHLYSALDAVALHASNDQHSAYNHHDHNHHQLYNGTNADDTLDPTRVGLIAARNFHVQSPLRYTTKEKVRLAARHLGLPNWQVAASPCLRSRLALGVTATREHLQRIETAERFVRTQLGPSISETSNLRVRLLARNRARIEVDADILPLVDELLQASLEPYFVRNLEFHSVSLRAFQSGSLAATATAKNGSDEIPNEERTQRLAADMA